jgi:hypothetical protein
VRQVPAGLDREDEAAVDLRAPALVRGDARQAIERAVQLDGVEVRGVVAEPAAERKIGGIDGAAPILVDVPARPDPEPGLTTTS